MNRCLLAILVSTFVSMPACSRLGEKIRIQLQLRELEKFAEASKAIQRHSQDEQSIFRIEYQLNEEGVGLLLRERANFRAMDATRFEITQWLVSLGIKPHTGVSAVWDTRNRTLIILNTGFNLSLIETFLGPLQPIRFS